VGEIGDSCGCFKGCCSRSCSCCSVVVERLAVVVIPVVLQLQRGEVGVGVVVVVRAVSVAERAASVDV